MAFLLKMLLKFLGLRVVCADDGGLVGGILAFVLKILLEFVGLHPVSANNGGLTHRTVGKAVRTALAARHMQARHKANPCTVDETNATAILGKAFLLQGVHGNNQKEADAVGEQ